MSKSGKNVAAAVALKKFCDVAECAKNLVHIGVMQMDYKEMHAALDILVADNRVLPFELQLQVTRRVISESIASMSGPSAVMKATVAGEEAEPEETDANDIAENVVDGLQVWTLYSDDADLADDWEHAAPAFKSLAALVEDNAADEKEASTEASALLTDVDHSLCL